MPTEVSAQSAPPTLLQQLRALTLDIKLSHSVFALPFALLATFLAAAADNRQPTWAELVLILICMVLARTVAMTVNRLADARFDAENPRTAGRAIPAGRMTRRFALGATFACSMGFVVAASLFENISSNSWPLRLSPLVLVWVMLYSFTKRFTWLCHLVLGSALALSPLAAAIAIHPPYVALPPVYLLATMVMCWVAGFDIIYAMQDVAIDREARLYSMPSRLGENRSLVIAGMLHIISITALVALGQSEAHLQIGFTLGTGAVMGLLILEHVVVWRSRAKHIPMVFITINGLISLLLGALGIFDVLRSL